MTAAILGFYAEDDAGVDKVFVLLDGRKQFSERVLEPERLDVLRTISRCQIHAEFQALV